MAMRPEREPFIPIRVANLVALLCNDTGPQNDRPLNEQQRQDFQRFANAATSHVHARYLELMNRIAADYASYDPDQEMLLGPSGQEAERLDDLIVQFAKLLDRASFKRLSRDELEVIMRGASQWGVDMRVPWDAYEKLDVYVRGRGLGRRVQRKWYRFYRQEEVVVPTYSRVVLVLKQRPHKALGRDPDTSHVFLKLFKDIPTMDIEMLLPGTTIRMPVLDRVRLGGTGLGSLGYVMFKLQAMAAPLLKAVGIMTTGAVFGEEGLLTLITLYTPLALIGGYAYKTYANFSTTKRSYELQLSQSLYFQNLDNNAGVIYRLLDAAEEQELREVLLAYYFLWKYAGQRGWTETELDQYIELDLARHLDREVDFDIADAVRKLQQGGLVTRNGERLVAMPLPVAIDRAAALWHDTRDVIPSEPPPIGDAPATATDPAVG